MGPLTGWSVAVTAERRADELAQLLTSHGASALSARLVTSRPFEEAELRRRTDELRARRPEVVVASTAIGVRRWIALAWSWGMGEDLLGVLRDATVVARGSKAAAALLTEGIDVSWRSSIETLEDVADHLLAEDVSTARIAVQLDGSLDEHVPARLRAAGAEVVPIPVYRVEPELGGPGARRLGAALRAGEVDAVTFTCPAAVEAYAALCAGLDDLDPDRDVVHACVGPITAAAARRHGLGSVAVPERARLGATVRALVKAMDRRVQVVELAGQEVRLQGRWLLIGDGAAVPLTPRERGLLAALLDAGDAVVSKAALARAAWTGDVDEHAVEVAVNRLRRKLGPAAAALETTNRRGYRLARGPRARRPPPA